MGDPSKSSTQATRPHTVRWDLEDWERIEAAAAKLGQQQHLDLDPVDIIRSGTRRLVDEILATNT